MPNKINQSKILKMAINAIFYICYLGLLFPTIIAQGIFHKEIMIGDPFYTSRIKSASNNILEINGNYLPTGSIFGGKTDLLSFGEMFIGGLGSLLQISVSDMYIYSSLLIGIGILYLLQKIFKLVNWDSSFSLFYCILGLYIFWGPFLPYGMERPISPQIVLLLWLTYILVSLKNMLDPSVSKSIWVGVIAGLSLYIHYPFIFLQIESGLFILLIISLKKKKSLQTSLIPILVSCLLAIPNLLWNFNLSKHTEYKDLMFRAAMVNSHLPAAGKTGILGVIIIILTYLTMKNFNSDKVQPSKKVHNFIIIQTIACVGIANSNLLTGKSIEFSNHFEIFIYALFILTLGIFIKKIGFSNAGYLTNSHSKNLSLVGSVLIILVLVFGSGINLSKVPKQPMPTIKNQEIWQWANRNLDANVGILFEAQAETAAIILEQKLFFSNDMFNFNFSQNEINKRYFANYGCVEEEFSNRTFSGISGVRKEALVHKIDRYIWISKILHLGDSVSKYLNNQKDLEVNSINSLKIAALNDFSTVSRYGCIEFSKSRGVNYIFTPQNGNWNRFSFDSRLKLIAVVQNMNVYQII